MVKYLIMDLNCSNHGDISAKTAENRLRRDDEKGNYLIRQCGKDLIVSYVDNDHQVKHILIPFAKNSSIRQQIPELHTKEDVLNFVLTAGVDFLFQVNPPNDDEDGLESTEEPKELTSKQCPICEVKFHV